MTEEARPGDGRFHSMTVMESGCQKNAVNYLTGAWKVLKRPNGWDNLGNWGQSRMVLT